jgi:ankyrin repeat protein
MSKAGIFDAVKRLDIEATRQLLDAKPALADARDRSDRNLLHVACSSNDPTALRMVTFLLDRGLDIEAVSGRDRCTPLFFAVARSRNPKLVKLLLDRGASVSNAPGGALFAAAWYDDVKNLDLLLKAGAKIDVVVGITPFLAAWCWKKFAAARFLATHGANVNFQDKKGRTALQLGIEKEFDPAQLRWLVQHGASPDIADNTGGTARVKASRKRDKRWAAALTVANMGKARPAFRGAGGAHRG